MTAGEGVGGPGQEPARKKAHRARQRPPIDLENPPPTPPRPTPAVQLFEMTRARIESLEKDKRDLSAAVDALRSELDSLRPEHAKLKEAYGAALAGNLFSTVLVAMGGALISGAGYSRTDWYRVVILTAGVTLFA